MTRHHRVANLSRGFTLVEVMVALGVLTTVTLGVAQLFAVATNAAYAAREQTTTTLLAASKMDQLRSLHWTFDEPPGATPVARTDRTTNLSGPVDRDDGPGLAVSPADSLERNAERYVDYLDADGRWVGTGADPPAGAQYIRRWSVQPLPDAPDRTLVLQVLVTTVLQEARRSGPWRRRSGSESLLVSVLTRKT